VTNELERQVERGSLFTHTALSENAERLTEVETILYGLIEALVTNDTVEIKAISDAAAAVRQALEERGETVSPGVSLRVDPEPDDSEFTPVDCAARLHVCRAVCCRLHFALTSREVESAKVRWDLGQPYRIRQDTNGVCVHNDPETHDCGIYDDRPSVCRRYSCARDERIWSDFDNMVLNTAWIEENLNGSKPHLAQASMVWLDPPTRRGRDSTPGPGV
jgi:Fe-S-cluster containining protein